eukprot:Nk52_evm21s281 gene=Nk52_evmTU21s281
MSNLRSQSTSSISQTDLRGPTAGPEWVPERESDEEDVEKGVADPEKGKKAVHKCMEGQKQLESGSSSRCNNIQGDDQPCGLQGGGGGGGVYSQQGRVGSSLGTKREGGEGTSERREEAGDMAMGEGKERRLSGGGMGSEQSWGHLGDSNTKNNQEGSLYSRSNINSNNSGQIHSHYNANDTDQSNHQNNSQNKGSSLTPSFSASPLIRTSSSASHSSTSFTPSSIPKARAVTDHSWGGDLSGPSSTAAGHQSTSNLPTSILTNISSSSSSALLRGGAGKAIVNSSSTNSSSSNISNAMGGGSSNPIRRQRCDSYNESSVEDASPMLGSAPNSPPLRLFRSDSNSETLGSSSNTGGGGGVTNVISSGVSSSGGPGSCGAASSSGTSLGEVVVGGAGSLDLDKDLSSGIGGGVKGAANTTSGGGSARTESDYEDQDIHHLSDTFNLFQVSGVKQSKRANNRISVFLSPISTLNPGTKSSQGRISGGHDSKKLVIRAFESLWNEELNLIDPSKVRVRFSNVDTDKNFPCKVRGRARKDELYEAESASCNERELLCSKPLSTSLQLPKNSGGFLPFNTLCKAQKYQALYLASEFRECGMFNGAIIKKFSLKICDSPDKTLENFRIAYSWTEDDSITEFHDTVVVHGPQSYNQSMLPEDEWVSFELSSNLIWDGKSNLVIELSKDERHSSFSWPATGGIYTRNTTSSRSIGYKDNSDSSGQYPFPSWIHPAKFRRVPALALGLESPPCVKLVCEISSGILSNTLVHVDVSLDGVRYTKNPATFFFVDEESSSCFRSLVRDFSTLLDKSTVCGSLADVRFEVGASIMEAPDIFNGHQMLLASRSPVFAKLFYESRLSGKQEHQHKGNLITISRHGSAPGSEGGKESPCTPSSENFTIKVPHIRPRVFSKFLTYLYTADIEVDIDIACELFMTANEYGIKDLKTVCSEFLKDNTTIDNITQVLLSAEKWKVASVRAFCLDFLLWHFDSISITPGFAKDIAPNNVLMKEILISRRAFWDKLGSSKISFEQKDKQVRNAQATYEDACVQAGFKTRFLQDMDRLLGESAPDHGQNELDCFYDVVFHVGSEVTPSGDNKTFYAHKAILTCRCDFFASMFRRQGEYIENTSDSDRSVISVPNIRPEVFAGILQFLYTGKADISYDNVFELYRAADQYCLEELKQNAEDFVIQEITIDNVASFFVSADHWKVFSVREFCLKLAVQEFNEVSITPSFLSEVLQHQPLLLEILQARNTMRPKLSSGKMIAET